MTDEEAALLAELRAISNNSSSATRFDTVDEDDANDFNETKPKEKSMPKPKPKPKPTKSSPKKEAFVRAKPKSRVTVKNSDSDSKNDHNNDHRQSGGGKENSGIPKFGGFKDSSAPKTFKGEFGGAAEDADLLAELRAISMSSNSSNRFDTDDNEENNENDNSMIENRNGSDAVPTSHPEQKSSPKKKASVSSNNDLPPWKRKGRRKSLGQSNGEEKSTAKSDRESDDALPPWKRKNKTPKKKESPLDNVEIMVTPKKNEEPPEKVDEPVIPEPTPTASIPPPTSTFQGERGGAAEDADLLAELRAISMQSSANRFDSNDDENIAVESVSAVQQNSKVETSVPETKPLQPKRNTPKLSSKPQQTDEASLPPWKRNNRRKSKPNNSKVDPFDNIEVMTPPTSATKKQIVAEVTEIVESVPLPSPIPPKVSNDGRSGKAEDADLLAELRAISMKSSSAYRFDHDDENDDSGDVKVEIQDNLVQNRLQKKTQDESPTSGKISRDSDSPWKRTKKINTDARSDPFDNCASQLPGNNNNVDDTAKAPSKNKSSNNFTGERGGSATDADLSSPSGSSSLPPWKRKNKPLEQERQSDTISKQTFNSSSPPNTFQGERGGAAEDADLLAELRAISNKSSSADRFTTEDNDNAPASVEEVSKTIEERSTQKESKSFSPPWKRKVSTNTSESKKDMKMKPDNVPQKPAEVAAATVDVEKSGFPVNNSFQGERGGAAEDAALLAELRAISQQSSSGRFQETDEVTIEEKTDPSPIPPKQKSAAQKKAVIPIQTSTPIKEDPSKAVMSMPSSPTVVDAGNDEIVVTVETVRDALGSKNWKFRKAAYELLSQLVQNSAQIENPRNEIPSDQVLQSLDELVPTMMKESNAGALDAALRFALLYTDHCDGATRTEQAGNVSEALTTGPGLASARPSTSKLVKALLLKTMEVGKDGVKSIHAVVSALLTHGLSSRKPKVVVNSVQFSLDAAYGFGAASLPLGIVTSNASKMLQHSNRAVRETAIQILAEICRAVGSKDPLEDIISELRTAQVAELDKLLEDRSEPKTPTMRFRHQTSSSSTDDALAVLQAGAEEAAAEAFASRKAVNIFNELKETEYASKMKEAKWSEKAGALDILIGCGGKKPYKLEQPSSIVNYNSLISELKRLLEHTHFAVKSKSMNALSMLAEGVGERLFPNLRPLLIPIIALSKDKKLTTATENCVDSLFGNVVGFDHLMDKEDGIHTLMKEKGQKNPIVRKSALSFLSRCLVRCEDAGPRGKLTTETATEIAKLCIQKTKDSDASVRTEAVGVLKQLLQSDNDAIRNSTIQLTKELETSNPRVFKTLHSNAGSTSQSRLPKNVPSKGKIPKRSTSRGPPRPTSIPRAPKRSPPKKRSTSVSRKRTQNTSAAKQATKESSSFTIPPDEISIEVQDAWSYLASLDIENWSGAEDEGGVVSGLKSSNWKYRKEAINTLAKFSSSEVAKSSSQKFSESVIVVVKDHTKQFKDSNFNILKAVMELFLAVLDLFEMRAVPLDIWMTRNAVGMCVEKIADKKFSSIAPSLLTRLCELQLPEIVIAMSIETVNSIKSPLQHEGLLSWATKFCTDFGGKALGKCFPMFTDWVLKECSSSNVKVKTAAMKLIGEMHSQLGPSMKALVVANGNIEQSVKEQVEKKMDSSPMAKGAASITRQKVCLVSGNGSNASDKEEGPGFEIPKTDIVAALPSDCISRMGLREGKDAWKKRKEALEEVEDACNQYNGLISSSPQSFKSLVELVRALKARLGDSQSNLKPLAAKNIASILGSVDVTAQAKLGKIVYGSLISAAMNDNKKLMRDASMDALKKAIVKSELDGGGVNKFAMEPFMSAFATELSESGPKAIGLPNVLEIISENVQFFPKVDGKGIKSKGRATEAQFGQAILKCLTSSKSETRALAEGILRESIKSRVMNISSVEKSASKLINAEQRKVRPILDNLGSICIDDIPLDQSPKKNIKRPASTIPFNSGRESPARPKSTLPFESRNGHSPTRSKVSSRRTSRSKDRNSLDPRKRSMSRGRRESAAASRQGSENSGVFADLMSDPAFHPLKSETAIFVPKEHRISKQRDHLSEYPEEPSGKDTLNDLKRVWAPLLPHGSVEILFPPTGIKVQDDASLGCELLSRGIEMIEEDEEEDVIINQLDLLIRWYSYALCSRETTKGMQSLISFLMKLATLLRNQKYQLTDTEGLMLLPYLLEKAGAAKGRFRDMIPDLITNMVDDGIYPLEKYGSLVCISVIEHSSTPKTRGLAVRECQICVERVGLSAIGKKGILTVAKSFSDETFTENKAIFLDLIESIITKMNGDIKRFMKLCGGAHLSSKAKDSIEKRMSKRSNVEKTDKRQPRVSLAGRRSLAPAVTSSIESEPADEIQTTKERALHDETDGPFKFSFNSSKKSRGITNQQPLHASAPNDTTTVLSQDITSRREAKSGAAASLRQRLRQIRDRHQPEADFSKSPVPVSLQISPSSSRELSSPSPPRRNTLLRAIMEDVDDLLAQSTPLGKNTDKSSLALIGLRRLHASLTNGTNDSTGTDPVILEQLRGEVTTKVSFCVFKLASMLEFGFRCGSPTHVTGISIPLISVSIAGLMAIFIDPDLSQRVSESAVSITIRQATSSLLDHRLSATSSSVDYGLDPSTCKKMVKAINKLAIQTTHGVKRDISFQALMSLQLQFCIGAMEQNVSPNDFSNAHHRMSRIITKLFNRVLKAECNEVMPFSGEDFNLEAVLGSLESVLSKSQPLGPYSVSVLSDTSDLTDLDSLAGDKMAPCRKMCSAFMVEMLKAKQAQNRATDIKIALREIGYIRDTFTGRLFISCCNELGLHALISPQKERSNPSKDTPGTDYDADHLSELIFAVGNAEEDNDRVHALEDLRLFMDSHPGIDLESHLSSLSVSFRKFILEQMKSPFRPPLRQSSRSLLSGFSSVPGLENSITSRTTATTATTNTSDSNRESMSMSEKLRYLKSKINAAEETAQSVIESGNSRDMPLPPPKNMSSPTAGNFSSLRQRLAEASEKRAQTVSPEGSRQYESAALGNAAILRARLETVKRMSLSQT